MLTNAEKRAIKAAKWAASGPAIIQRPLRKIAERTAVQGKDAKGNVIFHESATAKQARHAANRGRGDVVKRLARLELS